LGVKALRLVLELQVAMALGALACFFVGSVLRASSTYAAVYHPGTVSYFVGDVVFLTVPAVVWMVVRDRRWPQTLWLAAAMLTPVAAIVALGELSQTAYLVSLVTAMYPAMSVGMVVYVLYRGEFLLTSRGPVPPRHRSLPRVRRQ
jgi:hypothetical protein